MFPIVEKLGGWTTVDPILKKGGVSVGREAKKKWRDPDRGMPYQARFILACAANDKGVDYSTKDFIWHQPAQSTQAKGRAA